MEEEPARDGRSGSPLPFNASFDDRPREYDDLRASGHMARRRVEFFSAVVDRFSGPVLEVGCGTGTLLRRLAAARPDRTFVGVEPLPAYVDFARARAREDGLGNVRFEVGTGEFLQDAVPDGWAGLVISVDALHHVRDTERVLTQIRRVTAPEAHWWAMEPNRVHPYVLAYHVLTPGSAPSRSGTSSAAHVRTAGRCTAGRACSSTPAAWGGSWPGPSDWNAASSGSVPSPGRSCSISPAPTRSAPPEVGDRQPAHGELGARRGRPGRRLSRPPAW